MEHFQWRVDRHQSVHVYRGPIRHFDSASVSDGVQDGVRRSLDRVGNFPYLSQIQCFSDTETEIRLKDARFLDGARKEIRDVFSILHSKRSSEETRTVLHYVGNVGNVLVHCLRDPGFITRQPKMLRRIPKMAKACRVAVSEHPKEEYRRMVEYCMTFDNSDFMSWVDEFPL